MSRERKGTRYAVLIGVNLFYMRIDFPCRVDAAFIVGRYKFMCVKWRLNT